MKPDRPRRPRPAAPLLICVLLAGGSGSAQALQLQVRSDVLTPAEAAASQQLLANATRRLPARWARALTQPIAVEWREDLPARVHGRAKARKILLDRALLAGWSARDPSRGNDDPAARAALSAVLHELAHLYDRTPLGGLSRDPRLLDLAGWQVRPLRMGLRSSRNDFRDRSPDPYELTRPAEFVAVNLEHYLLDPSYACRRPALHRHFSAHFGLPATAAHCAPGLPYVQSGADAQTTPLLELDPARVYAVDYLLAEGNERAMSRWGHSMLRLVICAPDRAPGPDCRLDLAHHRVLSFRAFVDDVQISSWRGLTGSYPSRLYLLPLDQVIEEYTRVELRGLQSIPLRLDAGGIASLLERAATLHWSYDGRYYFVGNNCAVETYKLLHDGVPALSRERLSSITPTGLRHRLARAGVADTRVLDDAAEARRLGYYFEPMSARYQAMFDAAREELAIPVDRVQDWLDLAPHERRPWLQRANLRASAALLVLEQAALRRGELQARDELKRLLGHADADLPTTLREVLRLEDVFSRPARLLADTGYGLPQQEERAQLARIGGDYVARWREQSRRLHDQARLWLPAQRREALEACESNLDLLGQRLRRLHREAGGVRLDAG